jgi:Flp pilus assembly protein TadG
MSKRPNLLSLLRADNRGSYAIEFAIITPVFLVSIVGFLDVGYQAYVGTLLQGAVNEAGRNSTLEDATTNIGAIDDRVKDQVKTLSKDAVFESSRKSYTTFGDVGKPEPYTDTNSNGKRDTNECYQDINGNDSFDQDRGKDGQGGPDDIVKYTMKVTYKSILPVSKIFGWTGDRTASASTVLRNQPYGSQSVPAVKCEI